MSVLSEIDLLVGVFFLGIIILWAWYHKKSKIEKHPQYRYFTKGMFLSMGATFAFCGVYLFYYSEGGDTLDYHNNATAMANLFLKSPIDYVAILFNASPENYFLFDGSTGYPIPRHYDDLLTFNVSRITSVIELFSFGSYIGTSIIFGLFSYLGLWQVFMLFTRLFKGYDKYLFYAILCVPSVLFWSGGISKDTIALFGLCMLVVNAEHLFFQKKKKIKSLCIMLIASYLILSIKPYLFVGFFPAMLLWVTWGRIVKIRSTIIRILATPMLVVFGVGISFLIWTGLSSTLGEYASIDGMLEKALVSQQDLQNERYKGNNFDIGAYNPTVSGALAKLPAATFAGLYRPTLIEANNVVMLLSSLENSILLILSIFCLLKLSRTLKFIKSHPILLFCLVFSIVFGFAIGLSTSNFGALVRFKIPLLPFLVVFFTVITVNPKRIEEEKNLEY